ncbi:MAG TPA: hypothetical protein P5232_02715 [Candidatus Moranbacteria bacterium]|nr:hypothetical protein [Candidatus Moranbacteria bacterium]
MWKKVKKIFSKKVIIPSPEEFFNKKAFLFAMIFLAFSFDLLILGATKSFLGFNDEVKEKIITPLEKNIQSLISGYPMEKMVPYISAQKKSTAAFLIGIAKKESNWGKYSPHLNGKDCYNYWGYRGQGENVTPSGYTCFRNPREAVSTVSRRINELADNSDLNTPAKMIVWKCGWDCSTHSDESVSKWIADVDFYYKKVY